MDVSVHKWHAEHRPIRAEIPENYSREGLRPFSWSNAPGDVYGAHMHNFYKVLYCVRGSITFGLPDEQRTVLLEAGDRLELPPGVVHNAVVGPDGVTCLEAHRA